MGACVEADPIIGGIDYGVPDRTDAVPNTAAASSGLAVIDLNPGQVLHLFSDSVGANRMGLAVAPLDDTVLPVSVGTQSGMPGGSEQWQTVVQPDGQIWLQQPKPFSKCLTASTTSLSLQTCSSNAGAGWRIVPLLYSDLARLRNEATGQCLTLSSDATSVQLGGCSTASVWRFELISATGTSLTGLGYGTAQVSARGTISTLGNAAMRPCSDTAATTPSLASLSWLQITNAGDITITLDRVDTPTSVVSIGTLAPHAAEVLQVPGGSVVRVSANNQCVGFIDTAVLLRINQDGSFLAQGGTLHACSEQSTLHSVNALRSAQLRVLNGSATVLTFNWLNYTAGAAPAAYGTIGSGESSTLSTFQTHPWMLSAPDGSCRGILTLNQDPQP